MRTISLTDARRLAVMGALLSEPRPTDLVATVRWLGGLQIDPTAVVARAEQMVLWSRLGSYDAGELKRHLEGTGELFEYRAFILATDQLPMYRGVMEASPRGDSARPRYEREWLEANATFQAYVLRELRDRGPLRSRDLDDLAEVPWRTGGWSDGKNLGRMLDLLWMRGEIAIAARQGIERVWDLADRVLPPMPPATSGEVARWAVESQFRRCGLARSGTLGRLADGLRAHGWQAAQQELVDAGHLVALKVDGLDGEWLAHAEVLGRDFAPRTTLLSPFDRLVTDRERLGELFDFEYRLEMYVPAAKRAYGYYVLPILHGERFIGRLDTRLDRRSGVLAVNQIWAEPDAPADAWADIRTALEDLARWVGAAELTLPDLPSAWRGA